MGNARRCLYEGSEVKEVAARASLMRKLNVECERTDKFLYFSGIIYPRIYRDNAVA